MYEDNLEIASETAKRIYWLDFLERTFDRWTNVHDVYMEMTVNYGHFGFTFMNQALAIYICELHSARS